MDILFNALGILRVKLIVKKINYTFLFTDYSVQYLVCLFVGKRK